MLKGGGGNTAVFVTTNGRRGSGHESPDGARHCRQDQGGHDKPITTIINTHTHYDHVGTNPDFPARSTSSSTRIRKRTWKR